MNEIMIKRIITNEERLDSITLSINKLSVALNDFKSNVNNIKLLNKYYGSKNWFKDKEAYESKKVTNIKAGVLSEDAVWNLFDEINNLILEMNNVMKNVKEDE